MKMPNVYSRSDADNTALYLEEILKLYGLLTLADVYDVMLLDNPSLDIETSYKDITVGWTEANFKVDFKWENGGVVLELPDPVKLDI